MFDMSLRTKLLALFAALAVVPLLAIGVIDYVRSVHALEDLVASQTALIADQAATEIADRYSTSAANFALLASNAELPALFAGHDRNVGDSASVPKTQYFDELWARVRPYFASVVLVAKIRKEVFAWRQSGYSGASRTSVALLKWWFETEHLIENADQSLSAFRYYFAQREAVESIIWLYDVRSARDKYDLIRFDAARWS